MDKNKSIPTIANSFKNNAAAVLTAGVKTRESGKFSRDDFVRFGEYLQKTKMKVPTPALTYVEKIVKLNHSTIVSLPDGGGTAICRTVVDHLFEAFDRCEIDVEPDWRDLNATDPNILIKDIWENQHTPVPQVAEFLHYGSDGVWSKERAGLTCFFCEQECVFIPKPQMPGFFSIRATINNRHIIDGLRHVEGHCKLLRQQVSSYLGTMTADFLVNCPAKLDPDSISILKRLNSGRTIILLCPPDAVQTLKNTFPSFAVRRAPRNNPQVLMDIYEQKLVEAKMPANPLPAALIPFLIQISTLNVEVFLNMVGQVIEACIDDFQQTIPMNVAIDAIGSQIDVETAFRFRSELAGRGFRRRRLGQAQTYRFVHIDDMTALNVFEDATNITSVLVASRENGENTLIPVIRWTGLTSRTIPPALKLSAVSDITVRREYYAEPADPNDNASPLLMMARSGLEASRPLRRASPYLESIREGINTRGANGVFFVEAIEERTDTLRVRNQPEEGRNHNVRCYEGNIERGAVRRLLHGEDVAKGTAIPSGWVLFFHDEDNVSTAMTPKEVSAKFPKAFKYISQFETILKNRRQFRAFDPTGDGWLGIYSVTTAALTQHKVVVREIASGMIAAPVHDVNTIPDHKLYVIPCKTAREADQLSEVLNSDVVDYILRAFSVSTSITGSFLRYIGIRDLSKVPVELEGEALLAYALSLNSSQLQALEQIAIAESY